MSDEKKYTQKDLDVTSANLAIGTFVGTLFTSIVIGWLLGYWVLSFNRSRWEKQLLDKKLMYHHAQTGELMWTPLPKSINTFNDAEEAAIFSFENDPITNKENFEKAVRYNNVFANSAIIVDGNTVRVIKNEKQ